MSPVTLRKRASEAYRRGEIEHARAGKPGAIWMKMNSLVDPEIIDALYDASAAGVRSTSSCAASAACGRRFRGFRRTSASSRSSAASSSTAASSASATATACRRQGAGLYRLGRHDAAQPRPARRGAGADHNPTVHEQVLDQIMVANLADNQQSWRVLPDGTSTAHRADEGEEPFNAQQYFMTNPEPLRPRQALKSHLPKPIAQFKRRNEESRLNAADRSPLQGRLAGSAPVAVIDIGSNSIRLVVYEGAERARRPCCSTRRCWRVSAAGVADRQARPRSVTRALEEFASVSRAVRAGRRGRPVCARDGGRPRGRKRPRFHPPRRAILGTEIRVLTGARGGLFLRARHRLRLSQAGRHRGDLGGGSAGTGRCQGREDRRRHHPAARRPAPAGHGQGLARRAAAKIAQARALARAIS
jgi:hypothetical protein